MARRAYQVPVNGGHASANTHHGKKDFSWLKHFPKPRLPHHHLVKQTRHSHLRIPKSCCSRSSRCILIGQPAPFCRSSLPASASSRHRPKQTTDLLPSSILRSCIRNPFPRGATPTSTPPGPPSPERTHLVHLVPGAPLFLIASPAEHIPVRRLVTTSRALFEPSLRFPSLPRARRLHG